MLSKIFELLRMNSGLKQAEVAKLLNMSLSSIEKYEENIVDPKISTLELFAIKTLNTKSIWYHFIQYNEVNFIEIFPDIYAILKNKDGFNFISLSNYLINYYHDKIVKVSDNNYLNSDDYNVFKNIYTNIYLKEVIDLIKKNEKKKIIENTFNIIHNESITMHEYEKNIKFLCEKCAIQINKAYNLNLF